jgi:tRNA 5-methylaminomethyl-2-thiouridine biosynthesis bifunctional protein
MTDPLRPARIDWSQGLPFSPDFGDVYFSRDGGEAETRHVFLDGNRLGERFTALGADRPFTLIETGFGTGLNWLCTQALWQQCSRRGWLHVVSIEKHPLLHADLVRAQACWPAHAAFAAVLQARYPEPVPGFHRLVFPELRSTLTLVFADVNDALPRLCAQADAWFLDGFAPSRNPDMWQPALFAQMARLSRQGSTFATFSAAGEVRRGLQAAGFAVEKMPGFGHKREMLRGAFTTPREADALAQKEKRKPWLARPPLPAAYATGRTAFVIGAGVAGAAAARALAQRGWQVSVLDAGGVAGAASGNPAAMVSLQPATGNDALDHFPQQAAVHALRELQALESLDIWHPCGLLELPATNRRRQADVPPDTCLPASLWQPVSAEAAALHAGMAVPAAAVWQAQSGWLDAQAFCRQLLAHPGIVVHEHANVVALENREGVWRACGAASDVLARAGVVVLANSHGARAFAQAAALPLRIVRGQVSLVAASEASRKLRCVLCARGYVTPALADGRHCLGATFVPDDTGTDTRPGDHEANLAQLREALPALADALPLQDDWQGRAALRCQSPDYLPLAGPLADPAQMARDYAGLRDGKVQDYPPLTVLPGLYATLAHGSRGFTTALLAAEILAAEISGEPAPVSQACLDSLHPMRFVIRELKRNRDIRE